MSFQEIVFLRSLPLKNLERILLLASLHKPTSTTKVLFLPLEDWDDSWKWKSTALRKYSLDELECSFNSPKAEFLRCEV